MQKFLLFLNGVISGPHTEDQIQTMINNHSLDAASRICDERTREWQMLKEIPEFAHFFQAPKVEKKEVRQKNTPPPQTEKTLPAIDISDNGNEIHFKCPHCFQKYAVDLTEFVNARLFCNSCGKPYLIGPDVLTDTPRPKQQEPQRAAEPATPPPQQKETKKAPAFEQPAFLPGNIVCPHCWAKFDKKSIMYIAAHPELIGDPVAGEFEPKRFSPTIYNADGLPLDEKNMPCTDMACPNCHLHLPADTIDCKASFFSIVGAPSSGKSYYLTALIHTLRQLMPTSFDCSFYDADPGINSVINNYENLIFGSTSPDSIISLPKTQLSGGDFSTNVTLNDMTVNLPKPFIFRAQPFDTEDIASKWNRTVIFYDNAGEHFQPGNDNVNNPATHHLVQSDGIIFLFDPVNDPMMRRFCSENDPQVKISNFISAQTALFAEMVSRIRRHGNLNANKTSDKPLIIAVNKLDAWANMLGCKVANIKPIVTLTDDNNNLQTALDRDAILSVSFAVRDIMMKFVPGVVAQAEAFFNHVWFVPVSSFGCLPSEAENGRIGIVPQNIHSVWVEVPVEILFYESGLIPVLPRKNPPANPPSFVTKVSGGHIVFNHPVSQTRVSLPAMYADAVLDIGGTKYLMPRVTQSHAETTARAKNIVDWS